MPYSLAFFFFFFATLAACETLVSQPEIEPMPPALKGEILTNRGPGKSLAIFVYNAKQFLKRELTFQIYFLNDFYYKFEDILPFFQLMHIFLVTDHVTVQMTLLTTVRKSTRLAYFLTKAKKHRMWLCNSDCFPIKFQGWLQEWLPSSFAS